MDSPDDQALRRIWADAPPLFKFVEDRAEQLVREAPPAPGRKIRKPSQLSTLEHIGFAAEYYGNLQVARGRALQTAISDLVAGRIIALGRRSGSYRIETVDASFWIGADVEGDTVSRDGNEMIDVRIVPPAALPVVQLKDGSRRCGALGKAAVWGT